MLGLCPNMLHVFLPGVSTAFLSQMKSLFPDTLYLRSERDPHHRSRDVTVPVLQVKNPA